MTSFVLQTPSLQHLAQVKIVAQMWNQRDVFSQIAQSFKSARYFERKREESFEWKEIEEKVEKKVWSLPLPELFKEQLLHLITPMGVEIVNWCSYYYGKRYNCEFLDILLLNRVCWTMRGTVDYTKTAEVMVKDQRVDVVMRYQFSCVNCLDEEARELFPIISEVQRQAYIDGIVIYWTEEQRLLIAYFTCTFNGNADRLYISFQMMLLPGESINKFLFRIMLNRGNRATLEYWFKRLSPNEKMQVLTEEECRERYVPYTFHSPVYNLLYYLSLMNERQLEYMFRGYSKHVIRCLLNWPFQSLFVEAAKRGWQFMESDDCSKVLRVISNKIFYGLRDYDYCQLFMECWSLSSADYKQRFLSHDDNLCDLIRASKAEILKVVLNEGPADQLLVLFNQYVYIRELWMDESGISDAALMECKETAALESWNDPEDAEKRFKSQRVGRFVDVVIEHRNK